MLILKNYDFCSCDVILLEKQYYKYNNPWNPLAPLPGEIYAPIDFFVRNLMLNNFYMKHFLI